MELQSKPVRVFIIPRLEETDEGLKTALRVAMDSAGVGVWLIEKAAGVSHGTVANLARGVGGVEKGKAERIAASLERSVGDLFIHKDGAEVLS